MIKSIDSPDSVIEMPYLGVKPVHAFIPGGTAGDEWDSSQPTFSSYLNLFQPRPEGKLSPPYRHVPTNFWNVPLGLAFSNGKWQTFVGWRGSHSRRYFRRGPISFGQQSITLRQCDQIRWNWNILYFGTFLSTLVIQNRQPAVKSKFFGPVTRHLCLTQLIHVTDLQEFCRCPRCEKI